MKDKIAQAIEADHLEAVAIECLKGLLASGRNECSVDGYVYSVEEAAVVRAERFIKIFDERAKRFAKEK